MIPRTAGVVSGSISTSGSSICAAVWYSSLAYTYSTSLMMRATFLLLILGQARAQCKLRTRNASFEHENHILEMHRVWQYPGCGILKAAAKRVMPWLLPYVVVMITL